MEDNAKINKKKHKKKKTNKTRWFRILLKGVTQCNVLAN